MHSQFSTSSNRRSAAVSCEDQKDTNEGSFTQREKGEGNIDDKYDVNTLNGTTLKGNFGFVSINASQRTVMTELSGNSK